MKFVKGLYEFRVELESSNPETAPIIIKAWFRAYSKFELKTFERGFVEGAERSLDALTQFGEYRWARHGWKFDRE